MTPTLIGRLRPPRLHHASGRAHNLGALARQLDGPSNLRLRGCRIDFIHVLAACLRDLNQHLSRVWVDIAVRLLGPAVTPPSGEGQEIEAGKLARVDVILCGSPTHRTYSSNCGIFMRNAGAR
jgi:hypothetical protein